MVRSDRLRALIALLLMAVMLGSSDYEGILGVLEQTGRAATVGSFVEVALESLQREFGYRSCIFLIAHPSPEGPIATSAAIRGGRDTTEEYFERWREREPFEHPAARALIGRYGVADLDQFYDRLDRPQREFCLDFLLPQSVRHELSAHIDTGLPEQGFLTLLGDQLTSFGPLDRARLRALRPHLANQLRALTTGPPAGSEPVGAGELTPRQRDVAALAARGLSNAAIAASLRITVPTVKKHLVRAYRAYGVSTRAELASRWRGSVGGDAGIEPAED